MKSFIYKVLIIALFFLSYGCSDYLFNELNPVRLLCAGKFDPVTNQCILETDFPDMKSSSDKSKITEPSSK